MLYGSPDFDVAIKFYELWRGIATAFFQFIKHVCILFGVDVEEGKTPSETTNAQ